ncbi:adhesion G-protein coupled receptor G2 isoform X2 [Pimephales promelas]|uniref:adhesion G-protein coupled receptor G2 isoform X2 n=1 Tax=Pimephales promelas TaxID=90988 RepID=UPI0019557BD3|nr:adhesion G-protein coupled receptor G2 isoform X2 [Pimephales promelas]
MIWSTAGRLHNYPQGEISVYFRGMPSKRLSRWSHLDYVFFLVLLLVCRPVTSNTTVTTTDSPVILTLAITSATNLTTVTGGTTDNITAKSPSYSSTASSPAVLTDTSTTSSNISSTIPPMTRTTELHSTDNRTTENTSYDNTTFSESTTISTPPENTTFHRTTKNFTATTPEPSPSASANDTTPLMTTINQTFTTTVSASTPWHISQSCGVFYWITTSVEVLGTPQSEQNVITQLKDIFGLKLNACVNKSSSEKDPRIFEAMVLRCDQTNITKIAQCFILLNRSVPAADVCCFRNNLTEMNSNINVSVVGQIETVGVCAGNITQISAGQYDKCNQSITLKEFSTAALNISCGNSTNMIFPLDTNDSLVCPTIPSKPCYCSSDCKSSDFYYHINISLNYVIDNPESQIQHFLRNSSCQNTAYVCNVLQTFISYYQDSDVNCDGTGRCIIIVKLDRDMDSCEIHAALKAILKPHNDFLTFGGVVSRIAICTYNSTNPLKHEWRPSLSANFSSEVFCNESNRKNFNGYCSEDVRTVIPLNGSCNSSATHYQDAITNPPFFTSTTLSNTTNINATVTTSVNATSPANVTTTSGSSTTSGTSAADGLLNLSANASSLNATQVEQLLSQLETLLSGPNVSLPLANTSVNIVNNLLDVPVDVITPFSNRVSRIVDTVGLKLVVSGTSQSILSQSLALAVKKVDGANFQETSFQLTDSSNLQIRSNPGLETEDRVFRVGSTALGSVTLPASLTQNLTEDQKQLASRVQFNFFQKNTFFQDKSLGERKLNSGILGCSVANLSISGLQNDVLITLRNTKPIPTGYKASCVFWDFTFNGSSAGWNSSGCRVLNSSDEETQCACNHLTSFGILLDISRTPPSPEHLIILTYITNIGCGISAIFLSITLLTYLAFSKLRKDIPSKILIQLCLALLLLNLVFLLDGWLALYPDALGLCISTAFFLHYFLLASFTWMALEAVHMYLAIVKVFNTYISRFMLKIGFVGWGIPLIIVIIVIAVNKDNYGLVTYGKYVDGETDDFCWIKNDVVFYVAVVLYFCLVFLLNFTMFIVVMIQLCRIKKQNPHNAQTRSGWQEVRSVAGLSVLLGLTWAFAFFAWGPVNLAFMYLFAIFNTLQGLFIFVFHCAMKENVRRQWRTYLCCGRLRLLENSEWSRTATQKINKASKEKTSFHSTNSNNSRLSFLNHDSLTFDAPVGIDNPMDDSIITAAEPISGSDVVLNEINDQYRSQRSF